jgi:hypothetical protein
VAEGGSAYRTSDLAPADAIEDARDSVVRLPSAGGPLERSDPSFYELFLVRVERVCGEGARTAAEIATSLEVTKPQLAVWLKRALAEKKMTKTRRPVKYEWVGEDRQRSIF